MDRQTTLYLRGMPDDLVRETKAEAARRRVTLSKVVSEALRKWLPRPQRAPPKEDSLHELRPDMEWYEQNRAQLVRRFHGKHVAIVDRKVVDHDEEFEPLARRVFAKFGYRSIFMPKVAPKDPVVRLRSPRVVRP